MKLAKFFSDPVYMILLVMGVLALTVFPCSIFIRLLNYTPLLSISVRPTETPTNILLSVSTLSTLSTSTPTPTPTHTPTPTLTPTDLPPGIILPSTFTPTPTPTPTPTLTPTPTSPLVPTQTLTPASTQVPTSTPTLISPPTPVVAEIIGSVFIRWGPSKGYGRAGDVSAGESVIVLGRASDGSGLKVRTSEGQEGWISALRYIALPIDIENISIVPVPPPPPPVNSLSAEVYSLPLRSVVSGRIVAGKNQEFRFTEDQKETVFVLMFEPNVNLNNINKIEFAVYYINQISEIEFVGVGSRPGTDLDGDLGRGELIWRGVHLISGSPYYLRIINNSSEDINYCLITEDTINWNCP